MDESKSQSRDFTPEKNKLASGRYAVAVQLAFGAMFIGSSMAVRMFFPDVPEQAPAILIKFLDFAERVLSFYLGMKVGEIVAKSREVKP